MRPALVSSALRSAALLLLLAAAPARAFEPAEVDAAAAVARSAAQAHVRWLADDALEGRGSGAPGGLAAAELLIDELEAIGDGLDPLAEGRDAYRQPFDGGRTNLLAVIPGGARADEYVVVGGHYDHFAPGACNQLDLDDDICNGATDNAAGAAIVLAIGQALKALPAPPTRSVVLALWDGEEEGLLGSFHFLSFPLVPFADVVTYVNFDIQGANLAPSLRDASLAIGAESGGALLQSLVDDAIGAVGLDTKRLSVTFGQGRSDYLPFLAAAVPIVFFTDATNACYHTTRDDLDLLDFGKLAKQAEIGFRLVLALAEAEDRPPPTSQVALDTYEDLVAISDLLTRALADIDVVHPPYRDALVQLEAQARTRVAAGPDAFQQLDAALLAVPALDLMTNGLPCDARLLPEPDGAGGAAAAAVALAALGARRSGRRRRVRESDRPRCP